MQKVEPKEKNETHENCINIEVLYTYMNTHVYIHICKYINAHGLCVCVCEFAELKIEVQEDWGDSVQEFFCKHTIKSREKYLYYVHITFQVDLNSQSFFYICI